MKELILLRRLIREIATTHQEAALEDEIESLAETPEFEDVNAFIKFKQSNEEEAVSWTELMALARNAARARTDRADAIQTPRDIEDVKMELLTVPGWSFKIASRTSPKSHRGVTDNPHGSDRYAGNHGGSGMGTTTGGWGAEALGFGMGGGRGAMGGGYAWSAGDKRNLGMGAGRKK